MSAHKRGKVWLVAVDGSKSAEEAFHTAVDRINPKIDTLFILSVAQVNIAILKDLIPGSEETKKQLSVVYRKLLREYAQSAALLGVKYLNPVLSVASRAGEVICQEAEMHNVDMIVVGSRGLGSIKSLLFGSTSRYVVENAKCDVLVIKKESFPAEEHDNKRTVVMSEEAERIRRINEMIEAHEDEKKRREAAKIGAVIDEERERRFREKGEKAVEVHITKQYSILVEEQERMRREDTELDAIKESNSMREAAKIGAVIDEERERSSRRKDGDLIFVDDMPPAQETEYKTVF